MLKWLDRKRYVRYMGMLKGNVPCQSNTTVNVEGYYKSKVLEFCIVANYYAEARIGMVDCYEQGRGSFCLA
jgi:hypothetical protein